VNTLAVRSHNDVWATNSQDHIYHWDGARWTQVDGAAVQIAVGKDNTVGCVNRQGNIYLRDNGLAGQWRQVPGAATQIAVNKRDKLAVVNAAGDIYLWLNGTWVKGPGVAHSIALAKGYKEVWVTNAQSSGIFVHRGGDIGGGSKGGKGYREYNWQKQPGLLVQISGAGHNIWGVNAQDQIWRWTGSTWENIQGAATQVSVGWDGSVWCCNRGGSVYRWNGMSWDLVEGAVTSLAVRANNDVWATNAQQNIYHWDGMRWTLVDGAATQIAVGKDGHVACVNAGGNIYIRDGISAPWALLPGAAVQVAVHKKGTLAVVNAAAQIWAWQNNTWVRTGGEAHWITLPKGHKEAWAVNRRPDGHGGVFRHKH